MPISNVPRDTLSGVQESALLPLVSRALEGRRSDPLIRDDRAEEILARVEPRFDHVEKQELYHTIICLRVRKFDEIVRTFLERHPEGTVLNLGCGLDTRFDRLDLGSGCWIEVDLPPMIEVRSRFLKQTSRRRFVAASLTDAGFVEQMRSELEAGPCLILAEGVLMFLPPEKVRSLVQGLARCSAEGWLAFDAVQPMEVALRRFHPTLRSTEARLRWSLSDPRTVESWAPNVRLLEEWFYHDQPEPRLGLYRWLRWIPGAPFSARVLTFGLDS